MFEYLTPPPEMEVYDDVDTGVVTSVHYEFGNTTAREKLIRITTDLVVQELGIYTGNVIISIVDKIELDDLPEAWGVATDYGSFHDVNILSTLDEKNTIRIIAHELRHVWQVQTGFTMDSNDVPYYERKQEVDAYAYDNDFWQRNKYKIYDLYKEAIK